MKKFIAAISAAAMLFGAVSGLTACGGDAHDHIWDDGEITAAPSCSEVGVRTFHCTVEGCTETYTETVDKLAHEFTGEWVEVENGHAKQCANCETVDSANKTNHNLVEDTEKRVDATCHSDGEKYFVCDDCGAETVEYITDRPAHDFDNGEWVEVEGGHARQCVNCETVDSANKTNHNLVEDTEKRVDATCHSDGEKHFICEDCGAETVEYITDRPAHDFDNGEWIEVEDGHAKQCANCDAVDENVIAHTWNEGEITTQPTFWQDGEKTFTCNDCGKEKTEPVAALTSACHAEEFTTTAENNPWGYGKMEVTGWDGDNFQYNLSPATGTTQDAYIGDGIEIKGGWLSGGGSYISYTVTADITVRIDITSKQVDGGKRMDVRTVLGSEARYHGEYDGGNMSFGEEYTLSAGDTVYIVFTPKGEDTGLEQTDFTIKINKIA